MAFSPFIRALLLRCQNSRPQKCQNTKMTTKSHSFTWHSVHVYFSNGVNLRDWMVPTYASNQQTSRFWWRNSQKNQQKFDLVLQSWSWISSIWDQKVSAGRWPCAFIWMASITLQLIFNVRVSHQNYYQELVQLSY